MDIIPLTFVYLTNASVGRSRYNTSDQDAYRKYNQPLTTIIYIYFGA